MFESYEISSKKNVVMSFAFDVFRSFKESTGNGIHEWTHSGSKECFNRVIQTHPRKWRNTCIQSLETIATDMFPLVNPAIQYHKSHPFLP